MTFLFNGGPGSGSVWLQMGAFGPKRVAIPSDARDDGAPPYPLRRQPRQPARRHRPGVHRPAGHRLFAFDRQDRPQGILRGHRRRQGGRRRSSAAGSTTMAAGTAPNILGGESYGTTRSAAVVNELEGSTFNDVGLNGVILISTVLDFAAGADTPGNELSYITNLPSMAATALYHGKATAPSVEQFVEEARQFAHRALCRGAAQGPEAAGRGAGRGPSPGWRASPALAKPILEQRRPAGHARPLLQGTAARPRPHRRPPRQPLHRPRL